MHKLRDSCKVTFNKLINKLKNIFKSSLKSHNFWLKKFIESHKKSVKKSHKFAKDILNTG